MCTTKVTTLVTTIGFMFIYFSTSKLRIVGNPFLIDQHYYIIMRCSTTNTNLVKIKVKK